MSPPLSSSPHLPTELIVEIVLLAASDSSLSTSEQLDLARVSRACHRAIFSTLLLPSVCLSTSRQIVAFAIALDKNRLSLRNLASARTHNLVFRTSTSISNGYGPALFDAASAQSYFEKQLLPFIRIILTHCISVKVLHVEGVPRNLKQLNTLAFGMKELGCLVGHYGSALPPSFFDADRWTSLTHLQLHGPQFRFGPTTAALLSSLPKLSHLALVVPKIVDADGTNPLQVLIDTKTNCLSQLLLVGHAETEYVGCTEKYRSFLKLLTQNHNAGEEVRIDLVTVIRKDTADRGKKRVHPVEVSRWMFDRSKRATHWFDKDEEEGGEEGLEYWVEDWTPAAFDPTSSSAVTSAPRTGTNTPRQIARPTIPPAAILDPEDLLDDAPDEERYVDGTPLD